MKRTLNQFSRGVVLGGRYRIDGFVGRRRVGDTYLCHDLSETKVRLMAKVLGSVSPGRWDLDSRGQEFSLLRRIRHPNLARIVDFGIVEETRNLFLVEEYIEGKDLFSGTEQMGGPERLELIFDLSKAIRYLHLRELVHGDLNPSNSILAQAGEESLLKLAGYGLAGWDGNSHHDFKDGSLAYTAPEILMGGETTRSSDLYSLGILIYMLLARRLPFEDEDPGFLAQKHLQRSIDLRPIERLENGLALSQLLSRLLDKDPEKRPSSGEEVVHFIGSMIARDSDIDLSELEGRFSASRIVGRDREMSILKKCAGRVLEAGRGWSVFVTGEAGSGKTRCMEELRSWALLDGWRIVEGACRVREEGSYGPFRQILEETQPAHGNAIFRFGEASRVASSGTFDISMEYAAGQFRDLLTRELVGRLIDRPTLLLLHDFHWADEATGAVLDYLGSDIQAHPVLMCVSFRSGEKSGSAIERVVEQSLRQLRGEVIALEPLNEESVAELVVNMTSDPGLKETLGKWMFRSIGGNPFFLEEMLKHLVEQGILQRQAGGWRFTQEKLSRLEAPASVGVVLHRRIEQLSPSSRELANWLALFHRAVSINLLSSLAAHGTFNMAEALHGLNSRQMTRIEMKETEMMLEFRHALIPEVIRSDLPEKRRLNMHRRIAEALEREGAAENNLQELTMHCIQGRVGAKAVRYALTVADQARTEFAHENALRCFEYVFSDRTGLTNEELCDAAIEACDTMFALGRPKDAIQLLKAEMQNGRKMGVELKARMFIQLAFACRHLGDYSMQRTYCRKGLGLYRNRTGPEASIIKATLWVELAFVSLMQSNPQQGLLFLNRAFQSFSGCSDTLLEGRMCILAAFLNRITCNLHEALSASRKAESVLRPSGESHHACSVLSTIGGILMDLGRYPLALKKHREAVLLSEKNRSVMIRSQVLANLAECLCRMGHMQEALATAELAEKAVAESNNPSFSCAFNAILAEIKLAADDYTGAGRIIELLVKESGRKLALHTMGHAYFVAAGYHFKLGRFDSALEYIDQLSRNQRRGTSFYEYELTEALKARIFFERGSASDSLDRLFSLDRAVTEKRWPYQMCILKLHIGELLVRQQKPWLALKYARNASRLAAATQSLALMGRAHLLLGRTYSSLMVNGRPTDLMENGASLERESLADRAIRELEGSFRTIEFSGHQETAMQAHYELSVLFERLSRAEDGIAHARKAYECFCKIEERMPPEMIPGFCNAFDRARIKQDLIRIMEAGRDRISGTGMAEVHDDEKARILLRMSVTVSSIQELDPLLEAILDQLISAMGMQRALVHLTDESSGKLRLAKGRNDLRQSLEKADLDDVSRSLLEEVSRQGKPIVSANLREDPRMLPGNGGRVLCAPLKTSGRMLGLLYADHPTPVGGLSESTINLFAAFCNLSAIAIDNALAHQQLLKEKRELEQYLSQIRIGYGDMVGESASIEALRNRIGIAAASPLDILITGESGTGKELVARAIHRTGRRKSAVFVPIDCGSLSDSLAEAELFGYRKGAFTGASENRQGLLESANGGTVFLDEISNLPFRLQAKLLRVLQEREVRRIGETVQRKIDVHIIAATNRDLLEEIRAGRFRKDLYYRLDAMEIQVPPLRERPEDIPLLIRWFMEKTAESEGGRVKRFSPEAIALFRAYSYPGNIRELKNLIARSYYSAPGPVIVPNELPAEVRREPSGESASEVNPVGGIYRQILQGRGNFEELVKGPFARHQLDASALREILQMALKDSGGRYRKAFALLGIPDGSYSVTMQFLKRNDCYLDFRPFRKKRDRRRSPDLSD